MANTKELAICPRCSVELPHPTPAVCPNPACRHKFKAPTNTHFQDPDYLSRQKTRLLNSFAERASGNRPKAEEQERCLIQSNYLLWAKDAPMASRLCALKDAFQLLRYVLHSDMSEADFGSEMKTLINIGKSVGKLSESLENYFRCGGSTSDDEFKRAIMLENAAQVQARAIP